MANALEQPLLLPQDMADLRTLKKHKVFLTLKRDLAMVNFFFFFLILLLSIHAILAFFFFFLKAIQITHIVEKWVDDAHKQMKEEEGRCIATVEAFTLAEQKIKDLNVKLTEANKDKKSVKATLARVERQAENQHQQLRKTEDQLTVAREHIEALKKKLEKAEEAAAKAEQEGYDIRVKETKENLKA